MTRTDVLHHVNLPKHLLILMLGKNHPKWIRIVIGTGFMYGSTFLTAMHMPLLEVLGGLIHATGAVPYIDLMIEQADEKKECVGCTL